MKILLQKHNEEMKKEFSEIKSFLLSNNEKLAQEITAELIQKLEAVEEKDEATDGLACNCDGLDNNKEMKEEIEKLKKRIEELEIKLAKITPCPPPHYPPMYYQPVPYLPYHYHNGSPCYDNLCTWSSTNVI